MKTCQRKIFDENGKIIGECGNPATHSAYVPPINLCPECLHYYMEDEAPEAQASVKELKDIE